VVSEETVLGQILHQKFGRFKIVDFGRAYFIRSEDYFRKLRLIFMGAEMGPERYELSRER